MNVSRRAPWVLAGFLLAFAVILMEQPSEPRERPPGCPMPVVVLVGRLAECVEHTHCIYGTTDSGCLSAAKWRAASAGTLAITAVIAVLVGRALFRETPPHG